MKLSAACIRCIMERQEERVREIANEDKKTVYLKEVAGLIAFSEPYASAPYLLYRINKVYKRVFGVSQDYEKEKEKFNQIMLALEPELKEKINSGTNKEDILRNAINYSKAANYIDYGAISNVNEEKLFELLDEANEDMTNEETFQLLLEELKTAKELVFLVDNCGEVVADKILIEVLKEQYPELNMTAIVRGARVLNDVTYEDAQKVGLTEIVKVIGNGTAVPGTQIDILSREARTTLGKADIILSKGQANFETLYGCGLNIYYLFLCKCEWFSSRFGMERFKGVFINEKDVDFK